MLIDYSSVHYQSIHQATYYNVVLIGLFALNYSYQKIIKSHIIVRH